MASSLWVQLKVELSNTMSSLLTT